MQEADEGLLQGRPGSVSLYTLVLHIDGLCRGLVHMLVPTTPEYVGEMKDLQARDLVHQVLRNWRWPSNACFSFLSVPSLGNFLPLFVNGSF